MTVRLDENNIISFLHKFSEKHIRQGKHSNSRRKLREIPLDDIIRFLTRDYPVHIEQQGTKKFALTYYYHERYYIYKCV